MESGLKLVLGTVQFGLSYGIANRLGKPSLEEARRVLEHAAACGVRTLDTAPVYGDAEDLIGRHADPQRFTVITKVAAGSVPVSRSIRRSLQRLKRDHVDAILVHDADKLLAADGAAVWQELLQARQAGLTRRVGVSVYEPDSLRQVLDRYAIDVVQLPFNVYDTRFARAGLIQESADRGIDVHARSPFLQGLLLMPPHRLPEPLAALRDPQARFHEWAASLGLDPISSTLAACHAQPGIGAVVVGCQSQSELDEIVAADRIAADRVDAGREALARFALPDQPLVNPLRWPREARAAP